MKYLLRMLAVWLRSLRAPRLHIDAVCRTPVRINLGDLDLYRHVNNGTYLTIADLGRLDWMLRTGLWRDFRRRRWNPVVVNATITYRRSLHLGERVILETRFLGADERSIYLEHRFVVAGQIRAKALIRGKMIGPNGTLTTSDLVEGLPELAELPARIPAWAADWADATRLPPSREDAPSVWEDDLPGL